MGTCHNLKEIKTPFLGSDYYGCKPPPANHMWKHSSKLLKHLLTFQLVYNLLSDTQRFQYTVPRNLCRASLNQKLSFSLKGVPATQCKIARNQRQINTNGVRSYANLHEISRTAAGITYNQQLKLFSYNSDGANARTNSPCPQEECGGYYANQKNTGDYEHDNYLSRESENYPLPLSIDTQFPTLFFYWQTLMTEPTVNI